MSQLVGVVLAGGQGIRLGDTKGDLLIDGMTMARRAAGALWPLCGDILISLAVPGDNPAPEYRVVLDDNPERCGPLAGIRAAFSATGNSDLLVLACDYPNVDTSLMRTIVSSAIPGHDIVFPTDESGRDHPLVGLWRRNVEPAVNEAMEGRNYKVRALLSELAVQRLGPDDYPGIELNRVLINVNTIRELEAL